MRALLFATLIAIGLSLPAYADESWRQFDKDGNGELNFEEFTQLRITQYTVLDRNSDGQWTRREFVLVPAFELPA